VRECAKSLPRSAKSRRVLPWLLLACLLATACRTGGSDAILGPVERLNADPGTLGRFTFPYYTALGATDGGGAIAIWMRSEEQSRPLVYRRAADGNSPFGGERYLSPETLRETISIVPTLVEGSRSGELYAIWQARRPTSGDKLVVFRRSQDSGETWGSAKTINSEPHSFIPAMAAGRNGSVYAVWTDERGEGIEVFFNRSLDHGETWLAADAKVGVKLSRRSAAISVSIATDGADRVLIVWEESGPGGRVIRAASSADRGESWSEPVRVDDGGGRGAPSAPSIVFASGRAIVVWTAASTGEQAAGQLWSDVSGDGGSTWGEDVLLHEVEGGIPPRAHLVAVADKALAVFHAGPSGGAWDIHYAETDAAGGWQAQGKGGTRVSSGEGKFINPRLAVDAGTSKVTYYVTYEDDRKRIFLNRSIDAGKTWGTANELVYAVGEGQGKAQARYPQVAAADGVAYVMWEVWGDTTGMFKSLADLGKKVRPADLYVRRVSFRR